MEQTLTIIRGLPGSGKSTMAKKLIAVLDSVVWAEADHYFVGADGVYRFDGARLIDAHLQCFDKVERALEQGQSAIVSNTFSTLREMRVYFELALRYRIRPDIVTMHDNFGSVHDVPTDVVDRMRARFQHDTTPLYQEFAL